MRNLQGNISAYMIGVVAGVTIISTAVANKAKEQNEAREQAYLAKKKEQRQTLVKALEHVVSTKNGYNGAVTVDDLKKYYYSNAFDVTAGLDVAETADEFSEEKVRKEQIYKSYKNMKKQAGKMYRDVINGKSYIWPNSLTSYIKDAWYRDFAYLKIDDANALLSFNLPWDNSENKILKLVLPSLPSYKFIEKEKIMIPDSSEDDQVGRYLDISDNTFVIGSMYDDDNGTNSGAVYVYVKTVNGWKLQQKIVPPTVSSADNFGCMVAISGDTLIAGSIGDDDKAFNSGAVYVFTRVGATWTQQAKLTASDGAEEDLFGASLDLDGDYAVIGAYKKEESSGAAYIFKRTGSSWSQQAKLLPSNESIAGDRFGENVDIVGNTVLVTSPYDNHIGGNSGSGYIFTRSEEAWIQQAKLVSSDMSGGDYLGMYASLGQDIAVLGTPLKDADGINAGGAYVFARNGTTWIQKAKIMPDTPMVDDRFGAGVEVYDSTIMIGSIYNGLRVYSAGSSIDYKYTLMPNDVSSDDRFGTEIVIDDNIAIVGSFYDDDASNNAGAVYMFEQDN